MNTTQPMSPFVPVSPPEATPPAAERPRRAKKDKAAKKSRAARATAPTPEVVAAPPPKKVRKARVAKKNATKTSTKLGINEIVSATVGLKADEAKLLLSIVGKLDDLNKSGKVKVTAALGKLFG